VNRRIKRKTSTAAWTPARKVDRAGAAYARACMEWLHNSCCMSLYSPPSLLFFLFSLLGPAVERDFLTKFLFVTFSLSRNFFTFLRLILILFSKPLLICVSVFSTFKKNIYKKFTKLFKMFIYKLHKKFVFNFVL
jgi:hypothetical protein